MQQRGTALHRCAEIAGGQAAGEALPPHIKSHQKKLVTSGREAMSLGPSGTNSQKVDHLSTATGTAGPPPPQLHADAPSSARFRLAVLWADRSSLLRRRRSESSQSAAAQAPIPGAGGTVAVTPGWRVRGETISSVSPDDLTQLHLKPAAVSSAARGDDGVWPVPGHQREAVAGCGGERRSQRPDTGSARRQPPSSRVWGSVGRLYRFSDRPATDRIDVDAVWRPGRGGDWLAALSHYFTLSAAASRTRVGAALMRNFVYDTASRRPGPPRSAQPGGEAGTPCLTRSNRTDSVLLDRASMMGLAGRIR